VTQMAALPPDDRSRAGLRPFDDEPPDATVDVADPTPMREGSRRAAAATLAIVVIAVLAFALIILL
jgi:hypothetical protein